MDESPPFFIEQNIGRYLTEIERVHHKDGNKLNNDISNLELLDNQSLHGRSGIECQMIYKQIWGTGWLEDKYIKEEKSISEIAKIVGCNEGTIRYAIKN